jgi:hypothetical protein
MTEEEILSGVPEDEGPGITLTRGQLEAWAGKALTDEQVELIEESVQFSSIPEAISLIASQFPADEEET